MNFSPFEIFLIVVAAALILFLLLWAKVELVRWWKGRHLRKELRRTSTIPGFYNKRR